MDDFLIFDLNIWAVRRKRVIFAFDLFIIRKWIMALIDNIKRWIENMVPETDSDIERRYQITFMVKGTFDWDGLHTLTIPLSGRYTDEKAILHIRRANGVERSAKVEIKEVKAL